MNMEELQAKLDMEKWVASEKANKDLCGEFEYCSFCKAEMDTPCANAYNVMQAKLAKKATATKKPAAKKTTTKKTTTKATK